MPVPDTLTLDINDPADGVRHLGRSNADRHVVKGAAVVVFAAEWGTVDAARCPCRGDRMIAAGSAVRAG